jgi:hypothetical protein
VWVLGPRVGAGQVAPWQAGRTGSGAAQGSCCSRRHALRTWLSRAARHGRKRRGTGRAGRQLGGGAHSLVEEAREELPAVRERRISDDALQDAPAAEGHSDAHLGAAAAARNGRAHLGACGEGGASGVEGGGRGAGGMGSGTDASNHMLAPNGWDAIGTWRGPAMVALLRKTSSWKGLTEKGGSAALVPALAAPPRPRPTAHRPEALNPEAVGVGDVRCLRVRRERQHAAGVHAQALPLRAVRGAAREALFGLHKGEHSSERARRVRPPPAARRGQDSRESGAG